MFTQKQLEYKMIGVLLSFKRINNENLLNKQNME